MKDKTGDGEFFYIAPQPVINYGNPLYTRFAEFANVPLILCGEAPPVKAQALFRQRKKPLEEIKFHVR